MRLCSLFAIALLAVPTLTYADTILVGTDLSTATHGGAAVLCPIGADCSNRASQFTFSTPVLINSISVVVSAYSLTNSGDLNGHFTIGLGSLLGVGITSGIGAGDIIIHQNENITTEEFTFSGLNLNLAAGTYYLGMAGDNVQWDYAQPLLNTVGTLGLQLSCDPYLNCGPNITRWNIHPDTYAMEIDGTTSAVPEPSALALFSTGILGIASAARRKTLSRP